MLAYTEITVCAHAWYWTDDEAGNGQEYQEYTDRPELADGWCVYTRHDFDFDIAEAVPFHLLDEADFATEEEAMAEAERRAELIGCKVHVY